MKRLILLSVLFILLVPTVVAQYTTGFKAVFWNVENLFDTRHDSLKNDNEFLPESIRHWHAGRFKKKINNVARTIVAIGEGDVPDIVGLCEVENDYVLKYLTRYSALKELGYRYVMTECKDARGIDVALLYQRGRFRLIEHQSLSIPRDRPDRKPTRDILHVVGALINADTLDVFVVHFPSRSGGVKESEPYRVSAARQLRQAVDSLFQARQHPQVIIMGDFNDTPTNKSISKILNATHPTDSIQPKELYHLLAQKAKSHKYGSHKYRGEWKLLDHIIVSGNLLRANSNLYTSEERADVVNLPFLLEEDTQYGGMKPFRTYNGMKYIGGFSDHLPVFANFQLQF